MVDFHSHILPGIDDGASDIETSIAILEEEKKQGVEIVVLTPHFYPERNNVDTFLKERKEAIDKLTNQIKGQNFPELITGAEVSLTYDLPKLAGLEKLCIGDSNLILIELPYITYNEWVLDALFAIAARGLCPVIAHFERFVRFDFFKALYEKILAMGFHIQINATFIYNKSEIKFFGKLIKNDVIPILGSDVHNLDTRTVHLEEARNKIKKKFKQGLLDKMDSNTYKLLNFR